MIQSPPCAPPCWRKGKEEPFGKSQLQAVERTIKDFCLRRVADICSVLGPRAVEMSQTPARPRGSSESGNSLADRALPLGDAWRGWGGQNTSCRHGAGPEGARMECWDKARDMELVPWPGSLNQTSLGEKEARPVSLCLVPGCYIVSDHECLCSKEDIM